MKDEVTIRKYNPKTDKEHLFEIWYENNQNQISDEAEIEQYRDTFNHLLQYVDGSFEIFVAVLNNEVIGYQSALPIRNNPLFWREHAVSSTFVKKKYQSGGTGYNLLKRMLKHLPDSNITLFFGQTQTSNTTMISVGKKLGFKKIGVIPISNKESLNNELVLYVYNVPKNK
ncbi:MAG: hypothetical protein COA32_03770 [Fluviicola sp.]|nr:MAG: hypothetical protein COA32_03770 [Fluviicola sp.]